MLTRLYNLTEATLTVPDSSVGVLRQLFRFASRKGILPAGAERWLNHDQDIERRMGAFELPTRTQQQADPVLPAPKSAAVRLGGRR